MRIVVVDRDNGGDLFDGGWVCRFGAGCQREKNAEKPNQVLWSSREHSAVIIMRTGSEIERLACRGLDSHNPVDKELRHSKTYASAARLRFNRVRVLLFRHKKFNSRYFEFIRYV